MSKRITLDEFRALIQGSTGPIVENCIPIIDGQFLVIGKESHVPGVHQEGGVSYELWTPEDMAEYLGSPDNAPPSEEIRSLK